MGTLVAGVDRIPPMEGLDVNISPIGCQYLTGTLGLPEHTEELCRRFGAPVVVETATTGGTFQLTVQSAKLLEAIEGGGGIPIFMMDQKTFRARQLPDSGTPGWCVTGTVVAV